MKKLSVIIVCYNSQRDILACLNSIFENLDIPRDSLEIIVVDNSSIEVFELTRNLIVENYGAEIKVIHNEKNGGYGQGNNLGIESANSKIICIVNPDVLFLKPIFATVLKMFYHNKQLAMVGGKQLGGRNISFWIRPEYDFFLFTAPISGVLNKLNIYIEKYFYLSGALLFLDAQKYNEVGGFDEKIFMYCEEADLTNKFLEKKYETRYRKDFDYKHLIDERTEAGLNNLKFLIDSYKIYFAKYGFNFESFLNRRFFTFRAMMFFGKLFNNKILYERNLRYIKAFQKLI